MKLLMLLSDSQELEDFYEDIIMTIKDYDRKNNAQLYETMCTYISTAIRHMPSLFMKTQCATESPKPESS